MSDLKEKFVHLTHSKSWRDAEAKFPMHTKHSKLEEFLSLNVKKSTPQAFSQFCAEAVRSTQSDLYNDIECTAKISEINKCTFVEVADINSLDPSVVTSGIKSMHAGGSLFVFYMGYFISVCTKI